MPKRQPCQGRRRGPSAPQHAAVPDPRMVDERDGMAPSCGSPSLMRQSTRQLAANPSARFAAPAGWTPPRCRSEARPCLQPAAAVMAHPGEDLPKRHIAPAPVGVRLAEHGVFAAAVAGDSARASAGVGVVRARSGQSEHRRIGAVVRRTPSGRHGVICPHSRRTASAYEWGRAAINADPASAIDLVGLA